MKLLIICLLAACFGITANLAFYTTKPSFLQTCNLKEKNFTKCSTNAVQKLFNGITNGLPDIGLMPIDPFAITKLKIFQGKGLVSVNALLSNVTIHGFGKTIVESNRVDPKTYDFITKIKVPKMKLEGQYSLIGQILIIPLRGLGNCWFEAKDLDIIVKSDVTTYKKQDWIFFNVTKIATKFTIGGLKLNMGNLFNGANKDLEKSTNEYLNANWKLVFESLVPILNETIENIMLGIFRKIFDNIPANYFIENVKNEI